MNLSDTIPVRLLYLSSSFLQLSKSRLFWISSTISDGCGIVPCVILIQQFVHVLSPLLPSLDHFLPALFPFPSASLTQLLLLLLAWILPFVFARVDILLSCCMLQLTIKLLPCLSFSLQVILPRYTYSNHLLFWFTLYHSYSIFFLINSYLFIPPPCLTRMMWLLGRERNLMISSAVWIQYKNLATRWSDGHMPTANTAHTHSIAQ